MWQPGETITGVPHAIASSADTGSPSERDSRQNDVRGLEQPDLLLRGDEAVEADGVADPEPRRLDFEPAAVAVAGADQVEAQVRHAPAGERHRSSRRSRPLMGSSRPT